ncbi:MAG: cysteine peptidase family C39 domain-containing protein [Verrucomicrobiota bacterium]
MNPWLETLGVTLFALTGVWLGRWFSRLPKWYWAVGYGLPLFCLFLLWLPQQNNALFFLPPFSWLTAGRREFALGGFIATLLLTTPLSRVTQPRLRGLVILFMALIVITSSVLPFLGPAINRKHLASLETDVNRDGVCLQKTDYTCGPAAAVTALRRLGLKAEEGTIAILAHTSFAIGTAPDVLAETLSAQYGAQGITADYRFFKTIQELRNAGEVLAVIKYGLFVDHYVAVLEVNDNEIVLGDPLAGKTALSYAAFDEKWRHSGVVIQRRK